MAIELYQSPASPPCMIIRVLAENLHIDLKLNNLDLNKGEQMTPELLKVNSD